MLPTNTTELLGSGALAEIMDANPVPCFVIDAAHRVIHWNKGCEQILGIAAADIIGTSNQWQAFYDSPRPTLADLIVDEKIESIANNLYKNKMLRRSPIIADAYEAEDFFPNLGSGSRRLFFTAAPIRNTEGQVIGAVETLQDVTAQRQAELVLRQSNTKLEELVAIRTAELAEANCHLSASLRKAEETSRIKSAFLATVSQELKSPLHGIIGVAELLQMDHLTGSTHDYAHIIQENGEGLFQLIENMLSLTETEAGEARLSLAPHSIKETLGLVIAAQSVQAKAKSIALQANFSPAMPEIVVTDAPLLTQIVGALIDNAIKFTTAGRVEVGVEGSRNELIITVTDTGPGIPQDMQSAIFEKFRQLEKFKLRQQGGLGLGLALAKARANALGGTLALEPSTPENPGARFVLRLPNQKPGRA